MSFPCRRGDFVDCLFPFAEQPHLPGPVRHIVYVENLLRLRSGAIRALAMFTTTSQRMIRIIPKGLSVSVSETSARHFGMRNGFVIDIHRLAILPLESRWFPDIEAGHFVIARADEHLKEAVTTRYVEMRRLYPSPVLVFGPTAKDAN